MGAAGGVGATRLTVEVGATLARDGRDVAVLDAAFATQGLAGHVEGRIDPDVTATLVARVDGERAPLGDALVEVAAPAGRLVAAPAFAPFEGLARAKAPEAAEAFEALLAEAADEFDHVLVDTPPVAANQAVAAVTAVDGVALVTLPGGRGIDALQRAEGRLADLGTGADLVVANRADEGAVPDADLAVPEGAVVEAAAPSCLDGAAPFAPAVADVAEALLGVELSLDYEYGLAGRVTDHLSGGR